MTLRIVPLLLADPAQAAAFLDLLDHYARDPMGGGDGLGAHARTQLVDRLQACPGFHGALAFDGETPLGLINCFLGFSTFAAQPLLNVHDLVVRAERRGQGIGQALLAWAETRARELGCCKLTLEVLANNERAMAAYRRAGYAPYVLDPAAGQALLLQKVF
ncbi:MAG: GNAT family N-acetyltransferase [Rhodocyclales bacterium]|nr:GNAT family N-acetyltransferase [Rhodocyclales bacterium]